MYRRKNRKIGRSKKKAGESEQSNQADAELRGGAHGWWRGDVDAAGTGKGGSCSHGDGCSAIGIWVESCAGAGDDGGGRALSGCESGGGAVARSSHGLNNAHHSPSGVISGGRAGVRWRRRSGRFRLVAWWCDGGECAGEHGGGGNSRGGDLEEAHCD